MTEWQLDNLARFLDKHGVVDTLNAFSVACQQKAMDLKAKQAGDAAARWEGYAEVIHNTALGIAAH